MRIKWAGIFVNDQERAARFYTEMLGFEIKADEPAGDFRWLTVGEPGEPGTTGTGVELLLEPDAHPAAQAYMAAIKADGIPATQFAVADVAAEIERLRGLGVEIVREPTTMGPLTFAVIDDTCGNLIQLINQGEPGDPTA